MLIRRCAVLFLEPREDLDIDWTALFAGDGALGATIRWMALAPHLGEEVEVTLEEMAALGGIGLTLWQERDTSEGKYGAAVIARLLECGLLIGDDPRFRERDEVLRSQNWRPLSAVAHTFSRWGDMRVDKGMQFPSFEELVVSYGTPPGPVIERCAEGEAIALPHPDRARLDDTLFQRYTGRNFDPAAVLPVATVARLLQRAFGSQGEREMAPGAFVLKKLSPSAGGLHPVEAYVLAQRIEGVAPGLYHYHPVRHALEPLAAMDTTQTAELAMRMVADQDWFVDAPMMVVLAARVERNFWKYRNHAKAYRALLLDAGHLSQTFYLLATEAGMPAFVTAAVNEIDIERVFGLDPLKDMVIAVCGCGLASGAQDTVEMRYEP
ncbi:putative peptide maturation dehydrogenase [Duganella violaceipulchra]|uniref:Peptide maturation dehydrogenase n=1 Tax=Duganella violaceipulchra TaxID=2849652 RepID=A0AA41HBY4_9BURK|nr:putative peptide maturation dehydrogenase [Duganella violaceicalia]MBV6322067.1 putative peptide maturation dehydrogenase [Duganella violaceicalia]MCP2006935.1 putative peptide maturation dehydrogenase [Duganella violaceicalia]